MLPEPLKQEAPVQPSNEQKEYHDTDNVLNGLSELSLTVPYKESAEHPAESMRPMMLEPQKTVTTPLYDINEIRLGKGTSEFTRRISSVPVQLREKDADVGGLFDARMGASTYVSRCAKCKNYRDGCQGHQAHIELPEPTRLFEDPVERVLSVCCMLCSQPLVKTGTWKADVDSDIGVLAFQPIPVTDSMVSREMKLALVRAGLWDGTAVPRFLDDEYLSGFTRLADALETASVAWYKDSAKAGGNRVKTAYEMFVEPPISARELETLPEVRKSLALELNRLRREMDKYAAPLKLMPASIVLTQKTLRNERYCLQQGLLAMKKVRAFIESVEPDFRAFLGRIDRQDFPLDGKDGQFPPANKYYPIPSRNRTVLFEERLEDVEARLKEVDTVVDLLRQMVDTKVELRKEAVVRNTRSRLGVGTIRRSSSIPADDPEHGPVDRTAEDEEEDHAVVDDSVLDSRQYDIDQYSVWKTYYRKLLKAKSLTGEQYATQCADALKKAGERTSQNASQMVTCALAFGGCGMPRCTLKNDNRQMSVSVPTNRYLRLLRHPVLSAQGRVRMSNAYALQVLREVPDATISDLGMHAVRARPESNILHCLPVSPPSVRPNTTNPPRRSFFTDFYIHVLGCRNDQWQAVHDWERANRMPYIMGTIEARTEGGMIVSRFLRNQGTIQDRVSTVLGSQTVTPANASNSSGSWQGGRPGGKANSNKPAQNLRTMLDGKEGGIRYHGGGRRVDNGGRGVASGQSRLDIDELEVGEGLLRAFTTQVHVSQYNVQEVNDMLMRSFSGRQALLQLMKKQALLGIDGVDGHSPQYEAILPETAYLDVPYATRRMFKNDAARTATSTDQSALVTAEIGSTVERPLRVGDKAIMNRQPSLHRLSMMTFRIKKSKRGHCVAYNTSMCTPTNGDMDGDVHMLYIMQHGETVIEAILFMTSAHNACNPQNGANSYGMVQSTLLAWSLMTLQRATFTIEQIGRLLKHLFVSQKNRDQHIVLGFPDVQIAKEGNGGSVEFEERWSISALLCCLLPRGINYTRGVTDTTKLQENPLDGCVIVNSRLVAGALSKKDLGVGDGTLLALIAKAAGAPEMVRFICNASRVGLEWLSWEDQTVSFEDVLVPLRVFRETRTLVRDAYIRHSKEFMEAQARHRAGIDRMLKLYREQQSHQLMTAKLARVTEQNRVELNELILNQAREAQALSEKMPMQWMTTNLKAAQAYDAGNADRVMSLKAVVGPDSAQGLVSCAEDLRRALESGASGSIQVAAGFASEILPVGVKHTIGTPLPLRALLSLCKVGPSELRRWYDSARHGVVRSDAWRARPGYGMAAMVLTGTKGKISDMGEMVNNLGLQLIHGSLPGRGLDGRSTHYLAHDDPSPEARGILPNSLSQGFNLKQMALHSILAILNMSESGTEVSVPGYMCLGLTKALESILTHYDGTLRDNDGRLIMTSYGVDGASTQFLHPVQQALDQWLVDNKHSVNELFDAVNAADTNVYREAQPHSTRPTREVSVRASHLLSSKAGQWNWSILSLHGDIPSGVDPYTKQLLERITTPQPQGSPEHRMCQALFREWERLCEQWVWRRQQLAGSGSKAPKEVDTWKCSLPVDVLIERAVNSGETRYSADRSREHRDQVVARYIQTLMEEASKRPPATAEEDRLSGRFEASAFLTATVTRKGSTEPSEYLVSPIYVAVAVERWLTALQIEKRRMLPWMSQDLYVFTRLTAYLREALHSTRIVCHWKMTQSQFDRLLMDLWHQYHRTQTPAGDPVGALAMQAMTQPLTQMQLNVFNVLGASEVEMDSTVQAFKNILLLHVANDQLICTLPVRDNARLERAAGFRPLVDATAVVDGSNPSLRIRQAQMLDLVLAFGHLPYLSDSSRDVADTLLYGERVETWSWIDPRIVRTGPTSVRVVVIESECVRRGISLRALVMQFRQRLLSMFHTRAVLYQDRAPEASGADTTAPRERFLVLYIRYIDSVVETDGQSSSSVVPSRPVSKAREKARGSVAPSPVPTPRPTPRSSTPASTPRRVVSSPRPRFGSESTTGAASSVSELSSPSPQQRAFASRVDRSYLQVPRGKNTECQYIDRDALLSLNVERALRLAIPKTGIVNAQVTETKGRGDRVERTMKLRIHPDRNTSRALAYLVTRPGYDFTRMVHTDPRVIEQMFDISVARNTIRDTLGHVVNSTEMVDVHHLELISRWMTWRGICTPVNVSGIESMTNFLQTISFQGSLKRYIDASHRGEAAALNTFSSRFAVGAEPIGVSTIYRFLCGVCNLG
jgi:DNA-directed RNA polymerase beta' subunit